jgi:2-keto-3-deoxygluconate permease
VQTVRGGASGMKIKKAIDRIPGGLMLVPLLLGACVHTFAPHAGKFLGSFSNALITGTLPILAVWFFCMGASISLKATPIVLRKSGVLVVTKVLTAAAAGVVASHFLPPAGITSGFLTGLSVLTVICVMNESNGGLYMALMQQYGTKEEAGAFCRARELSVCDPARRPAAVFDRFYPRQPG